MLTWIELITRQCRREYRIYCRQKKSWFNAVLFYIVIECFFPLTLPADPTLLRTLAPSVVWIAVLFSSLLSVERLVQTDYEEGILEQWLVSGYSISALMIAKTLVHWALTLIPMLLFTPVLALLFGLHLHEIAIVMLSLLCGSLPIIALCALASAFSITLQQKSVLMGLIVLPLTVPILILGSTTLTAAMDGLAVSGYLACLSALSCLAIGGIPFAIAGVMRENL